MKKRLLTPGPTPVPEETLLELARPVTFHRTAEFRQVLAEVLADLQYVFRTKHLVVPLTSSGTGGLEAAVANCLPRGSKAICRSRAASSARARTRRSRQRRMHLRSRARAPRQPTDRRRRTRGRRG